MKFEVLLLFNCENHCIKWSSSVTDTLNSLELSALRLLIKLADSLIVNKAKDRAGAMPPKKQESGRKEGNLVVEVNGLKLCECCASENEEALRMLSEMTSVKGIEKHGSFLKEEMNEIKEVIKEITGCYLLLKSKERILKC